MKTNGVLLYLGILLFVFSVSGYGQEVLFEDRFEGNLKPGWSWLRCDKNRFRVTPNGLEMQVDPYDEPDACNVLFRPIKNLEHDAVQYETKLTCLERPVKQYQQGGLCWRQNNRIVFKVVHELVDNRLYIFPGKVPVTSNTVYLRIIIRHGGDIVAEYRNENDREYRQLYEGNLGLTGNDQISLQCWNGPENGQQWMKFHYFRVVRLSEK